MKKYLIIFLFAFVAAKTFGQQVPNGDMELWDSTYISDIPAGWLMNGHYASLPCSPIVFTATKTNDKNGGNWAVELKAKYCIDDLGIPQVYIGFLACGNTLNPKLAHGIPYNERPAELNFFYKFQRVGNDTGFAKIALRTLDSAGYVDQIIGEGKISIINDVNTYSLMTVPINYYLPDTAEIMQIVFSTSKTLTDKEYFPLNTIPGNGANIGTTLWIDDITVSGGTIGVKEIFTINNFIIYPNPANNTLNVEFTLSQTSHAQLTLYNIYGMRVAELFAQKAEKEKTQTINYNTSNLSYGVFFIELKTIPTEQTGNSGTQIQKVVLMK